MPSARLGRRDVLAGIAGVGATATGLVPATAAAASDVVVLGDFESGLDGRESGDCLLDTVAASARPGAVTRGNRSGALVPGDRRPRTPTEPLLCPGPLPTPNE